MLVVDDEDSVRHSVLQKLSHSERAETKANSRDLAVDDLTHSLTFGR